MLTLPSHWWPWESDCVDSHLSQDFSYISFVITQFLILKMLLLIEIDNKSNIDGQRHLSSQAGSFLTMLGLSCLVFLAHVLMVTLPALELIQDWAKWESW